MIERYSKDEAKKIWDVKNKFNYFLDVELAVCKAYNKMGKIPDCALSHILKTAKFDVNRIDEIEKITHHDVIAFLTCVNENIGDEYSHFLHMGLTSSDVIDTAFALQIKDASNIVLKDIDEVLKTIKKMAIEHKNTLCLGRSHGIGAEIITFGFKMLNWFDMFNRAKKRIEQALDEVLVGQMSGPCGTYSNIDPQIEKISCEILKLKPATVSTQVISRDRHANLISSLAILGAVIESCALEIRHLARWEVAEVQEGFSKGQKGSSAMPHKKNPIASENLTGLSRILRGNLIPALENVALWHERDISHSSVERIIFPDSFILADYMLQRFNDTVKNLVINKENMILNAQKYGGIIYSQNALLTLTNKGMTRERAYEIVQNEAFSAYQNNGNFKENMKKHLTDVEIENCFNEEKYLAHIENIYERMKI